MKRKSVSGITLKPWPILLDHYITASISKADAQDDEVILARDKFNSLILQAMNTKSSFDVAKRDRACEEYKKLKIK